MLKNDHKMPPALCPTCNKSLDGALGVDYTGAPKPNDIAICLYCHSINVFTEDLTLETANAKVLREIAGDSSFKKALAAIAQTIH